MVGEALFHGGKVKVGWHLKFLFAELRMGIVPLFTLVY